MLHASQKVESVGAEDKDVKTILEVNDLFPSLYFGVSPEQIAQEFYSSRERFENFRENLPVAEEVTNFRSTYWWLPSGDVESILSSTFSSYIANARRREDIDSDLCNTTFFFRQDQTTPPILRRFHPLVRRKLGRGIGCGGTWNLQPFPAPAPTVSTGWGLYLASLVTHIEQPGIPGGHPWWNSGRVPLRKTLGPTSA
ncbi:hypothetical protein M427DRAFT_39502 [Gonapodya prolifera JEL478]|uniref:Uncharacterized protein n=1 Tax=Gonapodya prolifera (strain JEL478) TaxID=1344416 RepID=A0A138ZXH5_GONPJ|nr:hypothetical protein M427DRAFT_39502 [Gonapodya prolifera JEL478]|eukprot:KXS09141.1 hypothetical protein M427DRAFT_39502 [Gonapodya prolifera JEL478]